MDGSSSAFLKTFASFLLENVKKKEKRSKPLHPHDPVPL